MNLFDKIANFSECYLHNPSILIHDLPNISRNVALVALGISYATLVTPILASLVYGGTRLSFCWKNREFIISPNTSLIHKIKDIWKYLMMESEKAEGLVKAKKIAIGQDLYELGKAQNSECAISYYLQAATLNHSEAQLALGMCYMEGIGVKKNLNKAIEWFQQVLGNDNDQLKPKAQFFRGYCKEKTGCYFEAYMDYGNIVYSDMGQNANYRLGKLHENKNTVNYVIRPVANPMDVAIGYYKHAANAGHEKAKKKLELLAS